MRRFRIYHPGDTFGQLTLVAETAERQHGGIVWQMVCACGAPVKLDLRRAIRGHTKSCGCLKNRPTHGFGRRGQKRTSEYGAWVSMKYRCSNPKSREFKNYGARGISVCAEWKGKDGFINFLASLGRKPSSEYSLDRIDNNGNYEPGNCKWSTPKEQSNNKRWSGPRPKTSPEETLRRAA